MEMECKQKKSLLLMMLVEANIKYVEKQKGAVKDTLADTSKISVLGWKPSVKIEEGLKRFTKWCKNK